MKLIAAVLSLLGTSFANTAVEAASMFKIEAAVPQSREIGELIATHLFLNTLATIMMAGADHPINDDLSF